MDSLVQPLFAGPLDIVGDVHGEIDPLRQLLRHLGYQPDGSHAEGRRLVFVGDLTDRGPDSPAVVALVRELTESGRAQCVLGNHDLNLLLDHPKRENNWFYGQEFRDAYENVIPQNLADDALRTEIVTFFDTLPIALEREDLRVVHACWDDGMIDVARSAKDVRSLYHQHHARIESQLAERTDLDAIDRELLHQNDNPVKLLTSGPEERAARPIDSGDRVRYEQRVSWWNDYQGSRCVFGHYALPASEPRGATRAFCVDYGVGKRWTERREGRASGFAWKLAALRFPERMVVFDEGHTIPADREEAESSGSSQSER